MATIQDTIAEVQDIMKGLTGIRWAPDFPMDQPPTGITAMCYANNGRYEYDHPISIRDEYHYVYLEIIMPRTDLVRDMKALEPYLRSVVDAVNDALNSRTLTVIDDIESTEYLLIYLNWGGKDYIGYRFIFEFRDIVDS